MNFEAREVFIAIEIVVAVISLYALLQIVQQHLKTYEKQDKLTQVKKIKLVITGIISNIADTIGVGSFAIIVAFDRAWKLISGKNLPGTLNAHGVLPALVQSMVFLSIVEIDVLTLIVLLIAATLGAFLGSTIVANLNKNRIRRSMFVAYGLMAVLVFANQMEWLPIGGEETSLRGSKLIIGFFSMFVVGVFPAIGVGGYVPIQMVLFILGMAPIVAWPIMTTAGTIQQSVAAVTFVRKNRVSTKEALIIAISGVVGTLMAIPLVASFNAYYLRWLLFVIVLYNIAMLFKDLRKKQSA